ncbi:PAS domain S-box-containing protein [Rhodoblastus acidophilus]|uniref:PAS domain S-box protein n=1 Tax=Rhodoblastus acidophilus TaxID=1074 RepID=UPI0022258D4E|nr:PAS domain S-box protein [Rhodoblastus acidophilus]MCW2285895.1 PAS domain S-box-containing protein [Rhodoblastus acidophilus]MCW2334804.1 PAS domain S-box-containing protein [Rhodoblastus acidophilus]
MNEKRIASSRPDGALPATAAEAVETLEALVMGEADALVVETAQGPRVYTLRDASEPYRQLIERMSQAAVILGDGIVLYCNGALSRALGGESLIGARLAERVSGEDRRRFEVFLRAAAAGPQACEAALVKAGGELLPTSMTGAPLSFDGLEGVALVVTPLDDIESWRAARAARVESERRLTFALDNSPVVMFEQDLNLHYTRIFNPKLGYHVEDVLGRTDADLMEPACAARLEQIKRGVMASGRPVRAEVQTAAPGGPLETYDLYVEPRRDAAGAIVGVACVATDITQRKQAEEALRESEARFRALTEASASIIYRMSADWREMRYMKGEGVFAHAETSDESWRDAFVPADERPRVNAAIADAIRRKSLYELEHRVLRADGGVGWVLSRATPLFDERGEIREWFGAATDVTARKEAEEVLRESEARKEFLLALADAFKTLDHPDDIIALAAQQIGRRLNADQVIFAEVDASETVTVTRAWNGAATPAAVCAHRLADFGPVVEDLRSDRSVIVHDVATDPRLEAKTVQAHYRALAIGAFISVPMVSNARLAWVLCVHGRAARRWSASEIALVEEAAERAWVWTERARAEQALREGEHRIAQAQARAGIGTFWWELSSGRTTFNPTYYAIYGVAPVPHSYEEFLALVHPEDRGVVHAAIQAAISGGRLYEVEFRLRRPSDGDEIWIFTRGEASFDESGRPLVLSGIVQDITARKRAELALRDSEERYRMLHEGLRDGYCRVTMDGLLTEFNAVFAEMLGYAPDELRKLTYLDITPARWRVYEDEIVRTQIIGRGFSEVYEKEYIRKDGSVFPVELRTILMRDARGEPCAMWAIVRDISIRKQFESALAAAKAEAERANLDKSRFLAAASHDLRQPVQSLMLLMPLVERQVQPTARAAQVLSLMSKALGGLNVLLTAVLDVSRLDAGGIEPSPEIVSLRGLCERLAAEYAPKAEALGLELRVRARDSFARTDPALLERVLRNLLENALRYTKAGGALLAMRRRGDAVRIDVIDTGVGIPADKRQDIFKEFTQLDNPGRDLSRGLGLGLAIVARISNLLDLNVTLASRPGRGSRFSITLPVVAPEAQQPAIADAAEQRSGAVLVIEDNQILRLAIETILRESGYQTFAAASGEEAIDLAQRRQVDAIVTDYRLGAGLNGVEAAREIERRLGRATPKLLLTGEIGNQRLNETDLTDFEFLYKPISVDKLQAKLARMLERAGSPLA